MDCALRRHHSHNACRHTPRSSDIPQYFHPRTYGRSNYLWCFQVCPTDPSWQRGADNARRPTYTIDATPTYTIDATPTSTMILNATPSPTATCSASTLLYCDADLDSCTGNDFWKPMAGLQAFVASELPFGFERYRQLLWPHVAKAQAIMDQLEPEMRILVACWLIAVVAIVIFAVARKAIVAYTSREEHSQSCDLTIPGMDISSSSVSMLHVYFARVVVLTTSS